MNTNNYVSGRLEWIGVRENQGDIKSLDSVIAIKGKGLDGDKITLKKSKCIMQISKIQIFL